MPTGAGTEVIDKSPIISVKADTDMKSNDISLSNELQRNEQLINCLEPERLLIVKVRVQNSDLNALIDSGASRSIIKQKYINY